MRLTRRQLFGVVGASLLSGHAKYTYRDVASLFRVPAALVAPAVVRISDALLRDSALDIETFFSRTLASKLVTMTERRMVT